MYISALDDGNENMWEKKKSWYKTDIKGVNHF